PAFFPAQRFPRNRVDRFRKESSSRWICPLRSLPPERERFPLAPEDSRPHSRRRRQSVCSDCVTRLREELRTLPEQCQKSAEGVNRWRVEFEAIPLRNLVNLP